MLSETPKCDIAFVPGGFTADGTPRPVAFATGIIRCVRCSSGNPVHVNLVQEAQQMRLEKARVAGIDATPANLAAIEVTPEEMNAIISGKTWGVAVCAGFRVVPSTGRVVCGGVCLQREERQAGEINFSIDASANPNHPGLRQQSPRVGRAIPNSSGGYDRVEERELVGGCAASCGAKISIQQRKTVDGEWQPAADAIRLASGWRQSTAGAWYCGRGCAEKSAGPAPLAPVLKLNDASYNRAREAVLAASAPQTAGYVKPMLASLDADADAAPVAPKTKTKAGR